MKSEQKKRKRKKQYLLRGFKFHLKIKICKQSVWMFNELLFYVKVYKKFSELVGLS